MKHAGLTARSASYKIYAGFQNNSDIFQIILTYLSNVNNFW